MPEKSRDRNYEIKLSNKYLTKQPNNGRTPAEMFFKIFRLKYSTIFPVLSAIVINFFLLLIFHNRSWIPADDGVFAHVAERVAAGETLNAQISEFHPGYIHLVNAAAFRIFGARLVSLRYLPVLLAMIQSIFVLWIFRKRQLASLAAISVVALGFIQMPYPNTQPYLLFITLTAILCFESSAPIEFIAPVTGFLAASCFLFRQLTGAFLGLGVFTLLLTRVRDGAKRTDAFFARIAIGLLWTLLGIYFARTCGISGFIFFGLMPLVILFYVFLSADISNKNASRLTAYFLGGIAAGFLPILTYHLIRCSLPDWFRECFVDVFRLPHLKHIHSFDYGLYLLGGLSDILDPAGFGTILNGFYWLLVPLLAFINGALLFNYLIKQKGITDGLAFPFVSLFYALTSLFNSLPVYLYASAPLSLASILWLSEECGKKIRTLLFLTGFFLCGVGVYYHAGQNSVNFKDMIQGKRTAQFPPGPDLVKSGLWLTQADIDSYAPLVKLIQSHSKAADPILVMPNDAQIYFLSGRKNPFRFWNTAISLQKADEIDAAIREIDAAKPVLIIHHAGYLYNSWADERILAWSKPRYTLIARISEFDIYQIDN